jgi:hypothetical protein
MAQVTGLISSADGSFTGFENVNTEVCSDELSPPLGCNGVSNEWTLQLNTNTFVTPACADSPNRVNCRGWQQFVYANNHFPLERPNSQLWIQYWLLYYQPDSRGCPAGYNQSGQDCWRDSAKYVRSEEMPLGYVPSAILSVDISNGQDLLQLYYEDDQHQGHLVVAPPASDGVLGLAQGWNAAEYNIHGDAGASQAVFNDNATIGVRLEVTSGTAASPTCMRESTTGETNNLNLVEGSCCPFSGTSGGTPPAIQFRETNLASPPTPPFCLLNDITPIESPLLLQ